jgi:hypothetical protein
MKTVEVIFSHANDGYCREYYRTIPNNQLICRQEEAKGHFEWHTCIDDGCWEEPNARIKTDKVNIVIVDGRRVT